MQSFWVIVTRRCNLACAYCYQGSHARVPEGLAPFMSDRVWREGARFAARWAGPEGLRLVYYGGEPTLARDAIMFWHPVYSAALEEKGKRCVPSLTTNGTLLEPLFLDWLDKWGFSLLLSIDGPEWIHDQTRHTYDGRGSWRKIPVAELLRRRPDQEAVWQLSPEVEISPADFDAFRALGFKRINFNVVWSGRWDRVAQVWLYKLMRHAAALHFSGVVQNNLAFRFARLAEGVQRMASPCGTNCNGMLALAPEGWLYPSQELAHTAVAPGRAPGTAEHYRVGNVLRMPVMDSEAVRRVSALKTADMKVPAGYSCEGCPAEPLCLGGCHCRYVGQDGVAPENRHDVAEGVCETQPIIAAAVLDALAETGREKAAAVRDYWKSRTFLGRGHGLG